MSSRSVNKVILVGHVGQDAETRFTPAGIACTTVSVATNRRWKDKQSGEWKEETDWHRVVVWRAEKLAEYLTRGKQVYVDGRLQTRNYVDKDGVKRYATEIVAEDVILLGGGNGNGNTETRREAPPPRRDTSESTSSNTFGGITDDDVPFMRYDVPCL